MFKVTKPKESKNDYFKSTNQTLALVSITNYNFLEYIIIHECNTRFHKEYPFIYKAFTYHYDVSINIDSYKYVTC